MRRVDALLSDYAGAHRTRGNLVCHAIGITLIVFGTLSILQAVPIAGAWTAGEALVGLSLLYYCTLDVPLALAVLAAAALIDLLARAIASWRIGLAVFAAGWVFQGIGHAVYEKGRPAFFRNLLHLLTGPAFLVNEALHIRPVPKSR